MESFIGLVLCGVVFGKKYIRGVYFGLLNYTGTWDVTDIKIVRSHNNYI